MLACESWMMKRLVNGTNITTTHGVIALPLVFNVIACLAVPYSRDSGSHSCYSLLQNPRPSKGVSRPHCGDTGPELLAWELYSDDVISEIVADEVSMVGQSDVQRKMRLFNAVRDQIAVDPAKFQNLLLALRKQPKMWQISLRHNRLPQL